MSDKHFMSGGQAVAEPPRPAQINADELAFEPRNEREFQRLILESHPEWRARMIRHMLRAMILQLFHRRGPIASKGSPTP